MNETYYQALAFCQQSTREGGIDAALNHNGQRLDGLLVPPDVGQTYQIAAQAGKSFSVLPISQVLTRLLRLSNDHDSSRSQSCFWNALRACNHEHGLVGRNPDQVGVGY